MKKILLLSAIFVMVMSMGTIWTGIKKTVTVSVTSISDPSKNRSFQFQFPNVHPIQQIFSLFLTKKIKHIIGSGITINSIQFQTQNGPLNALDSANKDALSQYVDGTDTPYFDAEIA